jgi:uncharacterized membrane protein YkvA (DUF1232 family)
MNPGVLLRLARAVPKFGRITYCLFRDPRTPRWWKVGLGIVLAIIWTPFINIPETVPVLGQMEWAALTILAVRIAVSRAPQDLVEEHEAAIAAGSSIFHRDMAAARQRLLEMRARQG